MSRIGRAPVVIPSGVRVGHAEGTVSIEGPKGALSARIPDGITVEIESEQVRLQRNDEKKKTRALHGLARALVSNMVTGVTEGFMKELEIHGVGYRADVSGKTLKLAVGFSHPVDLAIPEGLSVSLQDGKVRIEGIDRQLVGQFAANVRSLRPPEPYKGKGIRYVGERVRRKVGKAGTT
jgi:large subunit ribosomal protein L6